MSTPRRLLEAGHTPLPGGTEHRVLVVHVAEAEDELRAPGAELIEDHRLLGDGDRVVERQHDGAEPQADATRPRGHRRREHERPRRVAVRRPVVLGERDGVEAGSIRLLGQLERRGVEAVLWQTEVGRAHVEADEQLESLGSKGAVGGWLGRLGDGAGILAHGPVLPRVAVPTIVPALTCAQIGSRSVDGRPICAPNVD